MGEISHRFLLVIFFEILKTFEGENLILCTEYCVRMKKTRAEIISFPLPISHFREKKDNSVVVREAS